MPAESGDPPGLDLGRLAGWLSRAVPEAAAGEITAEVIAGGKSNLTYRLRSGEWSAVLRRPPLGHVLETAHDMSREYRVMSALRNTDVPVPNIIALCEDAGVIGAPFYVMAFVPGVTYRAAADLNALGAERTHRIGQSLLDPLVALHRLEPAAVGLEGFGRPQGYLARQVRRWNTQLQASHTRDLPLADQLHRLLLDAIPESSASGIVHGDYRLDNALFDNGGVVAAVLDWEMATLGDPLADLALMLVYHRLSASPASAAIGDAPLADGFPPEAEIIQLYSRGVGNDLPSLGFHLGLASFKLAGILEGIHFRYLHGQTVGAGFDQVGAAVEPLLDSGIRAVRERV